MLARLRRTTTQDDRGASAVEYGLLVAAIAAVIIVAVFAFGGFVQDVFEDSCTSIQQEAADTPVGASADCTP
ncbi:MAG: Flp family type IVb pilin [Kineosporiaceae bacterium]